MTRLKHKTIRLSDGHRVGITTSSGGESLVFLHGFTVNRRVYDPLLELLAEAGYEVTAIDLAGHGDTDSLPAGHSYEALVDLVRRTLNELGIGKATFVGHSLGGRVAVDLAASGGRAHRVVLLGAAVGQQFDDYENTHLLLRLASLPFRAGAALVDTWADAPKGWGAVDYWFDLAEAFTSSFPGFLRVGWAVSGGVDTITPLDWLWHLEIPTVHIHGDLDLIVPVEAARSAADVSGGQLRVLEGLHHSWMIADPQRAAVEIMQGIISDSSNL